jgi:hypothetical protein
MEKIKKTLNQLKRKIRNNLNQHKKMIKNKPNLPKKNKLSWSLLRTQNLLLILQKVKKRNLSKIWSNQSKNQKLKLHKKNPNNKKAKLVTIKKK